MKEYIAGFIGFGNMAEIVSRNFSRVIAYDAVAGKAEKAGADEASSIAEVLDSSEYVFLCVKPQNAEEVFAEIKKCDGDNVIISIMAGVTTETICTSSGATRVIRAMPNVCLAVNIGMTALTGRGASMEDMRFAETVFAEHGKVIFLDEKHFDAVTALSGSGPAYVYKFVDAAIKVGMSLGLTFEDAKMLAVQTFKGGTEMIDLAAVVPESIGCMIESVCSKGGTTAAALKELDRADVCGGIKAAVFAAHNRSVELSK